MINIPSYEYLLKLYPFTEDGKKLYRAHRRKLRELAEKHHSELLKEMSAIVTEHQELCEDTPPQGWLLGGPIENG